MSRDSSPRRHERLDLAVGAIIIRCGEIVGVGRGTDRRRDDAGQKAS
jgi:hypothetical protein